MSIPGMLSGSNCNKFICEFPCEANWMTCVITPGKHTVSPAAHLGKLLAATNEQFNQYN